MPPRDPPKRAAGTGGKTCLLNAKQSCSSLRTGATASFYALCTRWVLRVSPDGPRRRKFTQVERARNNPARGNRGISDLQCRISRLPGSSLESNLVVKTVGPDGCSRAWNRVSKLSGRSPCYDVRELTAPLCVNAEGLPSRTVLPSMTAADEPRGVAGLHKTRRGTELFSWIPSAEHPERGRAAVDAGHIILILVAWLGPTQPSQRIVSIVSTLEQPLVDQTTFVCHLTFSVKGDGIDGTGRTTRLPPISSAVAHLFGFTVMVSTATEARHTD